jgi:hypothetical protein
VSLALPEVGLRIKDCVLHERDGKGWLAFPAKQRPALDGRMHWFALIEYTETGPDRTLRDSFQKAAVAAIQKLLGAPREGSGM